MSKEFTEVDAKNKTAELQDGTVYFWAPAAKFQLANYREEVRSPNTGMITKSEDPIRFYNNIYVTKNPDEIKFIRESEACQSGVVKEFPDMESAQKETRILLARKAGVREFKAEDVERTVYNPSEVKG